MGKLKPISDVLKDREATYVRMFIEKVGNYLGPAYESGNIKSIDAAEGKLEGILCQIPEMVEGVSLPPPSYKKPESRDDYDKLRKRMTHAKIMEKYGKSKRDRKQLIRFAISYGRRHK